MWGKKTGALEEIQLSIVLTIASYAAGGWEKIPSHKQSKHAVAAINVAKELGFKQAA